MSTNVTFGRAGEFVRAYAKGMDSGHKMGRPKGSVNDIHIEWRVHMILWAAQHAMQFPHTNPSNNPRPGGNG